jgi:hypothetical protein
LAAVGFSGGVQLRWDDLSNDLKPSLAGARVWRANRTIDAHTEFTQNSNKRQIADLLKTTFYVDLTAEAQVEYIYWVQNVNQDGLVSEPAGGKIATKTYYSNCPLTLSDSVSIIADANAGQYFRILFDHAITGRTLSVTNAKCGQKIIFELIQSSSGSDTLGLTANFALGTDIYAITLSTIGDKRDFMGVIYNDLTDKHYIVAWVRGYIGGGVGNIDAWTFQGFLPTDFVMGTTSIICTAPLYGGGALTTSRTIAISLATSTQDGYLSHADWITFNAGGSGTLSSSIAIVCVAPVTGGGTLSENRTISMTVATSAKDGYLAQGDWATFNQVGTLSTSVSNLSLQVGTLSTSVTNLGLAVGTLSTSVSGLALQVGTISASVSTLILQVGTISTTVGLHTLQIGTISTQIGTFSATLNDLQHGTLSTSIAACALKATSLVCVAPITGGGDLSTNRTISMTYSASGQDGYLTGVNWSTFNAKAPTSNPTFTGTVSFAGTTSIGSDGKMGINIAPSADNLHVGGNIRLEGSVSEYFIFGPSGVSEGGIGYAHGVPVMVFSIAGTTCMTLDSAKLDLIGNLHVGGTLTGTTNVEILRLASTVSGTSSMLIQGTNPLGQLIFNTNTSSFIQNNYSAGAQSLWMYAIAENYSTSGRYWASSGMIETNGVGGLGFSAIGPGGIRFYVNGSTVPNMSIDVNGSVGIGTLPNAYTRLSIAGLATSTASLTTGDVWVDTTGGLNILKIV